MTVNVFTGLAFEEDGNDCAFKLVTGNILIKATLVIIKVEINLFMRLIPLIVGFKKKVTDSQASILHHLLQFG